MTRVTRILCAAEPRGSVDAIEALLEVAPERDVHAVALVGDLSGDGADGYRAVFRALGGAKLPAYWVPGPDDAPIEGYLREAYNAEVVFPLIHGVHASAAFAPDGHVVFAGLGGEVSDELDAPRDEVERLCYPRWEPEYRLRLLRELGEHELILMFSDRPAHKGLGTPGREVLAELVATHRPRLVVCGGERQAGMLGRSLVVSPGSVQDGHFVVADLRTHEVELEQLGALRT